ncbi:CASP-like protein PIMP1 [Ipomoea triloba]|uniref:CASP-like protein PIMP1 n=1 Tax=Ipomoea triloba TaxID=35885 RepID=UPI00125DADA3|nr:CASP-like protein PIMP1 [Ipomoea triloba]
MGHWEKLNLALRLLSFASLVVSIIFSLTSTSGDDNNNNCDNNYFPCNNNYNYFPYNFDVKIKLTFKDFYAYRYTLSVNTIGTVYSFIQFVLAIVGKSDDKSSDGLVKANPYLDQVMAILLGTGAAAGFGLTLDLKHLRCASTITRSFLNKMTIASTFCAGGFGFTAASSFVSLKIYEEEMDVCC